MKKYFTKSNFYILLIALTCLVLLRFFFRPGFPETHDGQLYLARMANFYMAMRDMHFPTRWALNLNYQFGYPIFLFNYYTPYILGMIPLLFGADFETSFKIIIMLSLFVGGLFWFLLFKKRLNPFSGLIAALVYVTAPYQMLDILVRLSIGEIISLAVLPFLFWAIDNLKTKQSFVVLVLGTAFFALSHNILFLFGFPTLLIFALFAQRQKIKSILVAMVLGFCLTLFFWLPALWEKQYTNLDKIDMSFEYADHFVTIDQLIYSPWDYGYSYKDKPDEMSLQVGPIHWLIAATSIGYFFILKKKRHSSWLFYSLLFGLSIFAMTKTSQAIWEALPFVRYVQFPWRLLAFATIAATGLSAYLAKHSPRLATILALASFVFTVSIAKPGGWFDHDKHFYLNFPFTTSIMGANNPMWFNEYIHLEFPEGRLHDLQGQGANFQEITWKTQKHQYRVTANQPTTVMEKTAYFPGWQVKVNGQTTAIDYQNPLFPGIITFVVPAGDSLIETRFTEKTPARILGNSLSLISLATLIIIVKSKKKLL